MRRVLICAAVVAATWTTPLAMRTTLAQTPAAPTDSVARVIVKFKESSPLLRKQALSATSQHVSANSAKLADTMRQLSDSLANQLKELGTRLDSIQNRISNVK